jgi:hypothetical protein
MGVLDISKDLLAVLLIMGEQHTLDSNKGCEWNAQSRD